MNLWPDNFDIAERSPFRVLFSQSEIFNHHNLYLFASVDSDPTQNKSILLILKKESEVELLQLHHADSYPCTVTWEGGKTRARTEAEFIGLLAKVLNHQKTRLMIADLLKK